MSLILPDDLIHELKQLADADNRAPESLLREMLRLHRQRRLAESDSMPRTTAEVRQRVYVRARDYWREHNMPQRAALTDQDLDQQFDFIDADGVPHLKSDKVSRRDDPLSSLLGTLDTDVTDLSTSARDTLDSFYRSRYARPD
jgi:hypothetical protein